MRTLVAPLAFCVCLTCAAQGAAPARTSPAASASAPAATPAATTATTAAPESRFPGEPEVRRTVIEDDGARIEELRVRGVPQRIVVTTKGPRASTYEIITGDGSRDLSDGVNTSRGAAGKRVWRVLDF